MLLGEPAATPYDLRFSVFGFDVRISPWFWLAAVLIGSQSSGSGLLIWVLVVLLSILIHEMGHALAFRRFGISSHIVLYHFGGLAVPDSYGTWGARTGPREQVIISAAGPAAQMLAAAALVVILQAGGFRMWVPGFGELGGDKLLPDSAFQFVTYFVIVSIYWALLNLLPVYPLDGGQIARNVFLLFGSDQAIQYSLMLSTVAGGAIGIWGFANGQTFLGIMFLMLAYSSYQALGQYGGGGFGRR